MLSQVLKNGEPPPLEWLQELAEAQQGKYLLSVSAKVPKVTEADMRDVIPFLGLMTSSQTDDFMAWYRKHAVFELVRRAMFESCVEWAYEYVQEINRKVEYVAIGYDVKAKRIFVKDITFTCLPNLKLTDAHLCYELKKSNLFDPLRAIPAEVGIQLLNLQQTLAALDLDSLKKRSWIYWSVRYFLDSPTQPPLKQ